MEFAVDFCLAVPVRVKVYALAEEWEVLYRPIFLEKPHEQHSGLRRIVSRFTCCSKYYSPHSLHEQFANIVTVNYSHVRRSQHYYEQTLAHAAELIRTKL